MSSKHWLVATLVGAAAAQQVAAQPGPDTVILREGGTRQGKLESCRLDACSLSGERIPRASVEWVGLRRPPPTPGVRDKARIEIHMTDKKVVTATTVAVDSEHVLADEKTYPRQDVAWIHFGVAPRTGASWKGRMDYTFTGVRSVHTGHFDFTVQSDARGVLSGQLSGEETYKTHVKACNATIGRILSYDAVLSGQVNRANGGLAIDIASETSVPGRYHLQPPCPYQPMPWGGPNPYILYDEGVRRLLKNMAPSKHGTYQTSGSWPIPGEAILKATLTLRPADK